MSKKNQSRNRSESASTRSDLTETAQTAATRARPGAARRNLAPPTPTANAGRRKWLTLGLGGVGALAAASLAGYKAGWFGSSAAPVANTAAPTTQGVAVAPLPPVTLTPEYPNALRAANEIVSHYARALQNPSALIHAVRAFGKKFTLADGRNAVDYLCSTYAADREVNGRRYVYFPRAAEVHDNSYLKTFLEAGVSKDQAIQVEGRRYTLNDLGESAKALFRFDPTNLSRFDPQLVQQHLPWGMIAFSILVPPAAPTWMNAYNETINFNQVIDGGLGNYERTCAGLDEKLAHGEEEPTEFRQSILNYSCFGLHSVYGFYSAYNHGYRENNLGERLRQLFDLMTYRLQGDSEAITREADAAKAMGPDVINKMALEEGGKVVTKGAPPPQIIEVMRLQSQIKLFGHAFESFNYIRLHKLFAQTAEQQKRLAAGEQLFYDYLVKLRAIDLDAFYRWRPKFVSDIVIAAGHASRALKLLTPDNPDTVA